MSSLSTLSSTTSITNKSGTRIKPSILSTTMSHDLRQSTEMTNSSLSAKQSSSQENASQLFAVSSVQALMESFTFCPPPVFDPMTTASVLCAVITIRRSEMGYVPTVSEINNGIQHKLYDHPANKWTLKIVSLNDVPVFTDEPRTFFILINHNDGDDIKHKLIFNTGNAIIKHVVHFYPEKYHFMCPRIMTAEHLELWNRLDFCENAVFISPTNAIYVKPQFLTESMIINCLQRNGTLVRYFDTNKITENVCLAAIEFHGGKIIKFFPEKCLTTRSIMVAIHTWTEAVTYLDDTDITKEMIKQLIQINSELKSYFLSRFPLLCEDK
jgi:hypothetical protein